MERSALVSLRILNFLPKASFTHSRYVWSASSRVGEITTARGPTACPPASGARSSASMGMTNAAVFPDPAWHGTIYDTGGRESARPHRDLIRHG